MLTEKTYIIQFQFPFMLIKHTPEALENIHSFRWLWCGEQSRERCFL